MDGDADIASVGALLGDPTRARVLMAVMDGRALPASVLAAEAGVAASTVSEHLRRLLDGGLLAVESHGRHRYYRLASPGVARLIETMAEHAPATPVRSLREGTRAHALRRGRYCYDHLAGGLGVALMTTLIDRGAIVGGDGLRHTEPGSTDRLSAFGHDVDYRLSDEGSELVSELGIDLGALIARRRRLIRYCSDWTEQRHHLAGALGAALAQRFLELDWLRKGRAPRTVLITDAGRDGFRDALAIELDASGAVIEAPGFAAVAAA